MIWLFSYFVGSSGVQTTSSEQLNNLITSKPYNLKTFPISESRESSLALPSVGNEGAANLKTSKPYNLITSKNNLKKNDLKQNYRVIFNTVPYYRWGYGVVQRLASGFGCEQCWRSGLDWRRQYAP